MKHYKTEKYQRTILDKTVCDMCGAETINDHQPDRYRIDKRTIRYEWGFRFPEGNDIKMIDIDLCAGCFEGRLIPWLESMGVKVREEEQE
jgi:hypothetical protein